jgi:hypothetical protein
VRCITALISLRKKLGVNLAESVPVSDMINTNVVKARTLVETPVVLDLLDKQILTSGNISVSYDKSTSIVNAGTVNITNNYNFQKTNLTIEDITIMIDSNNAYTQDEKVIMKDTLTKITDILKATGDVAGKITPLLGLLSKLF